ncbi:hypothetical protein P4O66_003177 [Electrophorus voltai]|uniref:Reverse transcriptase domain-containing protein n=1 Tax=Electrophorus voltai TaxID=2609070 RepID=A0AAD8YTP0_9TELE|nr:hypothetical protein P4O66_003177 [Electrophorus voltai]
MQHSSSKTQTQGILNVVAKNKAQYWTSIPVDLNKQRNKSFASNGSNGKYHWRVHTIARDLLPFISVINNALSSGYVPTAFKTTRVVPILKKATLDSSSVTNYRQVSRRISTCLTDIVSWMTTHHLKLNPSKTELLFIPGVNAKVSAGVPGAPKEDHPVPDFSIGGFPMPSTSAGAPPVPDSLADLLTRGLFLRVL